MQKLHVWITKAGELVSVVEKPDAVDVHIIDWYSIRQTPTEELKKLYTPQEIDWIYQNPGQKPCGHVPMPAGQCPITVFDDRELNTVLHSLEVLKEIRQPLIGGVNAYCGCRDEEMNRLRGCSDQTACDHFEEVEPLTNAEIDALCARLQLRPEPVQSVDVATRDKLADDSTHAIAALCKDQTGRELTTDELDDLNDRITAFFVETLGKRSTK